MANNFHIVAKKNRDQSLNYRLFGDFDASSACELINALDKGAKKSSKVAIDTDGLRAIDDFGLSVFLQQLSQLNKILDDVEVSGRFSGVFQEE